MRAALKERLRAKLVSTRGETLVETLVSTLIMSAVMLMLCTAIVAAAKANSAIELSDTLVNVTASAQEAPQELSGWQVTVGGQSAGATVYTQNGFVYYEPSSSN